MARRLATMAKDINETLDGYTARIEKGSVSGDRKIKGSRLRWPGKRRYGNQLIVVCDASGKEVLNHNSAEAYRSNDEVESWLRNVREMFERGLEPPQDRSHTAIDRLAKARWAEHPVED